MGERLPHIALKRKVHGSIAVSPPQYRVRTLTSIHVPPVSSLGVFLHWIHTTVELPDRVGAGGREEGLIMNFSAALAERIQLKSFGAQVLPGWLVFGTLPR